LRRTLVVILLIAPVWGLAYAYVTYAPKTYATDIFLILPGEGANASLNLDSLGQASTSASSPWSSNKLSPVESYRKLLMTERVHRRAASIREVSPDDFPRPKIKLIDQTNFITLQIRGKSPEGAQANGEALLGAFNAELDQLRETFAEERERPNRAAIRDYQDKVTDAREALVAFQARTGLVSADQFGERIALMERTAKRVADIEAELERQAGEVRTLQRVLGANPDQAASALKLRADPIFQALLEDMTIAKIAFERARVEFGERHPKYIEARRHYTSISDAMVDRGRIITGRDERGFRSIADLATHGQRELMLSSMVELAATRDGLMAELVTLRGQHLDAQNDVKRLAGPAGTLDHLVREHQVAQAVFASALAKADTTKADQFAAYPLAQVVEMPLANPKPVSPSLKIAIIAAVGATFFILMGLTLIWMRGPILRIVGKAFAHPSADIEQAMQEGRPAQTTVPVPAIDPLIMRPPVRRSASNAEAEDEPPMPERHAIDDEPLIEIPKQVPFGLSHSYSVGSVMSVRLRPDDDAA
jgi:uncharacterized protein involved in exopolysaccharide biosynthesis